MPAHLKPALEGTIRRLRRGGWAARGLIVTTRNGQLFETQIGPHEFDSQGKCDAWLRSTAAGLQIESVQISIDTRR
jgi:hypothetical protein